MTTPTYSNENGHIRTQSYVDEIKTALNKGDEHFKKVAPLIFLKHFPDSEMFEENFKFLKKL